MCRERRAGRRDPWAWPAREPCRPSAWAWPPYSRSMRSRWQSSWSSSPAEEKEAAALSPSFAVAGRSCCCPSCRPRRAPAGRVRTGAARPSSSRPSPDATAGRAAADGATAEEVRYRRRRAGCCLRYSPAGGARVAVGAALARRPMSPCCRRSTGGAGRSSASGRRTTTTGRPCAGWRKGSWGKRGCLRRRGRHG